MDSGQCFVGEAERAILEIAMDRSLMFCSMGFSWDRMLSATRIISACLFSRLSVF